MRPTREQCGQHYRSPIWPCSGWALPCHGMLPPARCALTAPFHPYRSPEMNQEDLGGIFSVALSIGSRRPGVTWHPALRSPDFPPLGHANAVGQRLSGQLQALLYQSPTVSSENLCSGKQERDGVLLARLLHGAFAGPILKPTEIRGRSDSLRVTSCRISGAKKINMPARGRTSSRRTPSINTSFPESGG